MTREILVLGAGSFIGTHLVRRHSTEGSRIHLKHPEFSTSAADVARLSCRNGPRDEDARSPQRTVRNLTNGSERRGFPRSSPARS